MSDLRVEPISVISPREVLHSSKLTDAQKYEYFKQHANTVQDPQSPVHITRAEFEMMMKNRPLVRLRPIRNSFTKQGDKILLAKTLGIEPREVDNYIHDIIKSNFAVTDEISEDNINEVQDYVYRHGSKDQVVWFLEHELSDAQRVLVKLYHTLTDNSGGLADYFSRPIHRMSNKTLVLLLEAIDNALIKAHDSGDISTEEHDNTARWALIRIYEIQNNSKLIREVNAYNQLT